MSPSERLAAVRRGLDAAAQQATAATQGEWINPGELRAALYNAKVRYGVRYNDGAPTFIAAWSPARVLAHVDSLRTICDGIEATLERHYASVYIAGNGHLCACCQYDNAPCPDYNAALSSLGGLAAVWAPTEQETP